MVLQRVRYGVFYVRVMHGGHSGHQPLPTKDLASSPSSLYDKKPSKSASKEVMHSNGPLGRDAGYFTPRGLPSG